MARFTTGRLLGPVALALLAGSEATAAEPLRPKIAACYAVDREGNADGSMALERGAGNTPNRRVLGFWFDLFARSAADAATPAARKDALKATHRIEICIARNGTINCPGAGSNGRPWVLFDDSATPPFFAPFPIASIDDLVNRVLPPGVSSPTFFYSVLDAFDNPPIETDWNSLSNDGRFLVLAVNHGVSGADASDATTYTATPGGALIAPALVSGGGFCAVPQPLATSASGRFHSAALHDAWRGDQPVHGR